MAAWQYCAGHSNVHPGRTPLGGSTSLLTFPERGLVVAVTSNISFAGTRSIALKIAEVFGAQGKVQSRHSERSATVGSM